MNEQRPPHKSVPSSTSSAKKTVRTVKERLRNAAITGTAGGYLGGMLVEGKARVRIPALTRKILKIRRKTVGIHGARTGALIGALAGASNKGKRSDTVDSIATGGDWKFSAYIEDMKHGDLPKEVQADITRFVDATKDTPVVHYGMTVGELLPKADPANLETARKNLGTFRASRAAGEVLARTKEGSKYVLLMNDRVIDGHHFLAKAERGKVTSSLNVLDLTPARLFTKLAAGSTGLNTFEAPTRTQSAAIGAGATAAAGGLILGTRGGRNALRVVLKNMDKNDPRRLRLAALTQKRKDASIARNSQKAVAAARDKFRAEALPKPKQEPTLGDAVKTVKKRVKQRVVKAVSNIGANPGEVQMSTQFGLLGHPGAHKKVPVLKNVPSIPPGMAAYQAPGGVRVTNQIIAKRGMPANWQDRGKARKVGRILESGTPLPEIAAKMGGHANAAQTQKALRRHEIIHSIQASKRGFTTHKRIRDLVKDEVGAYATMNRRMKGGSKVLRSINAAAGIPVSVGMGIMGNGRLRKRAVAPATAAAIGGAAGAIAHSKAKKKETQMSTQFASERTRTQNLRDNIGLAKDAAGLGLTAGVGVGAHKLYKQGRIMIRRVGPRIASTGRAWHDAALKAGGTLDVVKDAVSPVATTNRGLANVGRKIVRAAKKATMWMHGDPRQPLVFDKPDYASPEWKSACDVVRSWFESPAPPKRDKLSKARDAALIGGGIATAGAAGVLAHKGGKVINGLAKRGRAVLRKVPVKTIGDNVRNSTRISADVGRIYGSLTEDVRHPKRYVASVKKAWHSGVAQGEAGPVKPWARAAVRAGKKLRLLEAQPGPLVAFGPGSALVLSGVGTLIGSQAGGRLRYAVQNGVKKRLAPRIGKKWARRIGRVAGYAPENVGAIAGGVAGSIAGGGIRQRAELQSAANWGRPFEFGGREQLKDVDSSGFLDPLDVFVGRKKGYTAQQVKDYHRAKNYVHDVQSKRRVGSAQAVAAAQAQMKNIRDNPTSVAHAQVLRSLYHKAGGVRKISERTSGLAKDAVAHLRGDAREKDNSGRLKKREWEKPWFSRTKNQIAATVGIGGGYALLKGHPRVRARFDRGVRVLKRKANSVMAGTFPEVAPLRAKGQKTMAHVQAKQQAQAQAKVAKTKATVGQAATNIASDAAKAKGMAQSATKLKPMAAVGGKKKPAPQKFGVIRGPVHFLGRNLIWNGTQFEDPLDAGWDIRDARGRSARVFAPGSRTRDRRPKQWHEKVENERKLWSGASLAGTLAGGLVTRKLLQGRVKQQVKAGTEAVAKRAARWKAVAKAQHGRLQAQAGRKVKIVPFNGSPRAAA